MKNFIQKLISWPVVIALLILSTATALFKLYTLNLLPTNYFIALCVVLVLIIVGCYFLMKPSKVENKGKVRIICGKLLSVFLSIVLLIGAIYINQGEDTLNVVTSADKQTHHYSLIVKNENKDLTIKDFNNKKVEYALTYDDPVEFGYVTNQILQDNKKIKLKEIEEYQSLAKDLLEDKCDAILINYAYVYVFEEYDEDFKSKVTEIWSYEIDTKVKDFSIKANVVEEPFTVYISGMDTEGAISTVSRSDVNMLVTINPKTHEVLMTSIPRDSFVELANKKKKDKLTHSGLAGVKNTIKTVENFLDVKINYYVRVNYTSLVWIINALDGVEVDVEHDYKSGANGKFYKGGRQKLYGEEALIYVRERKAFKDGDLARARHQQDVLKAMLNKMMSPTVIIRYNDILKAIQGLFETNMGTEEIISLLNYQIKDNPQWKFRSAMVEGYFVNTTGGAYMPSSELSYMIPYEKSVEKNRDYIDAVMAGEDFEITPLEKSQMKRTFVPTPAKKPEQVQQDTQQVETDIPVDTQVQTDTQVSTDTQVPVDTQEVTQ